MPLTYAIDKDRRLVILTGSERLTLHDFNLFQDQLLNDPSFNPEFNLLTDVTAVTDFDGSTDEAKQIASRTVFSPACRRAIVAREPHVFGMARLIHTYREMGRIGKPGDGEGVFYDLPSALRWLGLESSHTRDRLA